MKVVVYQSSHAGLTAAFAQGISVYGHRVVNRPVERYRGAEDCDWAVTVGASTGVRKIHADYRAKGIPFLVISDGFLVRWRNWVDVPFGGKSFGAAGPNWCVARNGVHAYGEHVAYGGRGGERWDALGIRLHEWRASGNAIIIGGQPHRFPNSLEEPPVNRNEWFAAAVSFLAGFSKRPLIWKAHPHDSRDIEGFVSVLSGKTGGRLTLTRLSFSDLVDRGVWAVVTYDSNLAVDAIVSGVPCFVGGRTMADPMCSHDLTRIESPLQLCRGEWCKWVAWTQWTVEEMRRGEPWRVLVEEWQRFSRPGPEFCDRVGVQNI